MNNLKNKKGFTLIELIVVIAILGILMLFLVPSFMGYAKDAKTQVLRANTRTVWTAVNAAIVKSDYDSELIIGSYKDIKLGEGFEIPFKTEVEGKLGLEFANKTAVQFSGDDSKKILSFVSYNDGKKQCRYYGSDKFDESGCTY